MHTGASIAHKPSISAHTLKEIASMLAVYRQLSTINYKLCNKLQFIQHLPVMVCHLMVRPLLCCQCMSANPNAYHFNQGRPYFRTPKQRPLVYIIMRLCTYTCAYACSSIGVWMGTIVSAFFNTMDSASAKEKNVVSKTRRSVTGSSGGNQCLPSGETQYVWDKTWFFSSRFNLCTQINQSVGQIVSWAHVIAFWALHNNKKAASLYRFLSVTPPYKIMEIVAEGMCCKASRTNTFKLEFSLFFSLKISKILLSFPSLKL